MPLSFDDIQARRPRPAHRDLYVEKLGGEVRIRRLSTPKKVDVLQLVQRIERDDKGDCLDLAGALEAMVEVVALSVEELDTDQGREFLRAEDLDVLTYLFEESLVFNGVDVKVIAEQIEAAKKN